jgi:hypothetical protein
MEGPVSPEPPRTGTQAFFLKASSTIFGAAAASGKALHTIAVTAERSTAIPRSRPVATAILIAF